MSKTRTITPLPVADFVPSKNDVSYLRPFRVWCQKVLPLVYDDSLSYYELLCKVVDYLNKTMEEVNQLGVDVSNLFNAFHQLQDYVNNYFDNLDVQEEINNKLDEMTKNGMLTTLFESLFSDKTFNNMNLWFYIHCNNHTGFTMQGMVGISDSLWCVAYTNDTDSINIIDIISASGVTSYTIDINNQTNCSNSHANSMTIYNGVLYICANYSEWYGIDYLTGNVVQIQTKPYPATAISYDNITGLWCFFEDHGENNPMKYRILKEDFSLIGEFNINYFKTSQGCCNTGNTFYVGQLISETGTTIGSRSVIRMYKHGKLIKTFILPYYIHEIEDIYISNSCLYANCTTIESADVGSENYIFKYQLSLDDNYIVPLAQRIPINGDCNVYINTNFFGKEEYGTADNPFSSPLALEYYINNQNNIYARFNTFNVYSLSDIPGNININNASVIFNNCVLLNNLTANNSRIVINGGSCYNLTLIGCKANITCDIINMLECYDTFITISGSRNINGFKITRSFFNNRVVKELEVESIQSIISNINNLNITNTGIFTNNGIVSIYGATTVNINEEFTIAIPETLPSGYNSARIFYQYTSDVNIITNYSSGTFTATVVPKAGQSGEITVPYCINVFYN